MRKTIVNALAAFATVRRLFARMNSAEPKGALTTREVASTGRELPQRPTHSARRQKRIEPKSTGRQARRQRRRQRRRRRKLVAAFLLTALGVFGSLATLYVFFLPRLAVGPSSSLSPSSPFATPFVLTNDGYLPIYDVDFSCVPYSIARSTGELRFENVEMIGPTPHPRVVESGEKVTTTCYVMFDFESGTDSADVSILVRYKPFGIPWRQEKRFRFAAMRDSSGNPHWFPKALSEPQGDTPQP